MKPAENENVATTPLSAEETPQSLDLTSAPVAFVDHELSYGGATHVPVLAAAFQSVCKNVEFWSNRRTSLDLPNLRPIFPFERTRSWLSYPSSPAQSWLSRLLFRCRWLRTLILSNVLYGRALHKQTKLSNRNVYFFTNVDVRHLLAILCFARFSCRKSDRLVVYFAGAPLRSLTIASALLKSFRLDNIHFAAESNAIGAKYQEYLGVDCHEIFFPVNVSPVEETNEENSSGKKRTLVFLGSPRREKGIDLVIQAIPHLSDLLHSGELELRIQSDQQTFQFDQLEEAYEQLLESEKKFSNVTLLPSPLERTVYEQELQHADAVLVPYHSSAYSLRGSLIPMEGVAYGKPLIISEGLMMSEVVERFGVRCLLEEETVEGIVSAIRKFLRESDALLHEASGKAESFRQMISPEAFVRNIEQLCLSEPAINE